VKTIHPLLFRALILTTIIAKNELRPGDVTQKHMKMTKDAKVEGSSQQGNKDAINRRNGLGPKHLKFFLLVFLTWRPKPKKPKPKWGPKPNP